MIDAALAPPRGSNLHTERKGKVLTHDTLLLANKQQNPIARHNGAVFFLLLSFPATSANSSSSPPLYSPFFSRHCVSTKKLTNRPRDAQVRLFIKKFLLRLAQSTRRHRCLGSRSKNLFALPPPAIASLLSEDITLQYCIILRSTSNFVCLDLTRFARGTRRASSRA